MKLILTISLFPFLIFPFPICFIDEIELGKSRESKAIALLFSERLTLWKPVNSRNKTAISLSFDEKIGTADNKTVYGKTQSHTLQKQTFLGGKR